MSGHHSNTGETTRMKFNWGTGIIITFALFFIGLAVIVVIAMRQRNDLVTEQYYAQELKHEEQMNRQRRAAALSAPVSVSISDGMAVVTFPRELRPEGVSGRMHFYRPADERKDFELPIALDSTHVQRVPLAALSTGLWRTKLQWMYEGNEYYSEESVIVR